MTTKYITAKEARELALNWAHDRNTLRRARMHIISSSIRQRATLGDSFAQVTVLKNFGESTDEFYSAIGKLELAIRGLGYVLEILPWSSLEHGEYGLWIEWKDYNLVSHLGSFNESKQINKENNK